MVVTRIKKMYSMNSNRINSFTYLFFSASSDTYISHPVISVQSIHVSDVFSLANSSSYTPVKSRIKLFFFLSLHYTITSMDVTFLKFLAYLLHKIILCKSISNLNCIIHCFVRCCSMSLNNRLLNA